MDFLENAMRSLAKSSEGLMKGQQLRVWLWITEMCLKYDKKPEEIISLFKDVIEKFK